MQIATWNVNSLKVRLPQVLNWLESTNCDILALQELKLENQNFPLEEFTKLGYNCVFNGQKTYNGVAIVSKHLIEDIELDIPNYNDPQKRVISATIRGVRVICVYVVNGESIDSPKFIYKMEWLGNLHNFIQLGLSKYEHLVLLGDFNIAPDDMDVYDPNVWRNKILCSPDERNRWQELLNLGLYDSFRLFNSEPTNYTWWDYRNFAFRRKLGLRIDHILISAKLKNLANNCTIDITPRKNERPSDHAPVILNIK